MLPNEKSCNAEQPPNVISWVVALTKLKTAGEKDYGSVVRQWNAVSSRQQHLTGAKAQVVFCCF